MVSILYSIWKNQDHTKRLSNLSKTRFLGVLEAAFKLWSAWLQEIPNNCKSSLKVQHVGIHGLDGEKKYM